MIRKKKLGKKYVPIITTKGHHLVGVTWPVKGSAGGDYSVTMEERGFTCDCISFYTCKHIKAVEKRLACDKVVEYRV